MKKREMAQKATHDGSMPTEANNHSDSELSGAEGDSNSISGETDFEARKTPPKTKKKHPRRNSEWEILEGLKDGQRHDKVAEKCEGYLMKNRKWPLKGWHKRYFVLDKGILVYAKSVADILRGKKHGTVDVGLSVISAKPKRGRIDIDAEELIFHLKIKNTEVFNHWLEQLKDHRLYRQHILSYGKSERKLPAAAETPVEDVPVFPLPVSLPNPEKGFISVSRDGSLGRGIKPPQSPTPHSISHLFSSRVAAWIVESGESFDQSGKELMMVQQNITQLEKMIEQLELAQATAEHHDGTIPDANSPNVKKDRKKFGLRKKKSSKGSSIDMMAVSSSNKVPNSQQDEPIMARSMNHASHTASSSTNLTQMAHMSNSSSSLLTVSPTLSRPHSFSDTVHLGGNTSIDLKLLQSPDHRLRDDFLILSKDVCSSLRTVVQNLRTERERLKQAMTESSDATTSAVNSSLVNSLRNSLSQVTQQNVELRSRLAGIAKLCDAGTLPSGGTDVVLHKTLHHSHSYSSSCLSTSEYYDAKEDDMLEPTSSEDSFSSDDEGSVSDNSEAETDCTPAQSVAEQEFPDKCTTGRRTKLPAPMPDTEGVSLWNLLCRNIGKDLSKVCMPVTINEPLSILQKFCEELEYSELLDKAAEMDDPYDRMVQVAAFAVAAYGSSYYRAGHKPFNPLLGETYECIREDKGFRFVAEQVSHHPPISVCHAESRNYIFAQHVRIKTKFWGKSMEFQPVGTVHVWLPNSGDHYQWNKITTCVHNLFGGQRWVDQYGELVLTNGGITCKLTFVKASYWSAKRHEIHGTVISPDGTVVRNLFGKWNEAIYCGVAPSAKCIWRLGTMPEDYELYYGFTRFAVELNELDPDMAKYLPPTDSRFRPDQRLLEVGNIMSAETTKLNLEHSQRERQKKREDMRIEHEARWFRRCGGGDDASWEYAGQYWEKRQNPGFVNMSFEPIW